jgi:DNA helicase-2/ATP-dependent DNA helicase PcrA
VRVGDPNQAITSTFTAANPRYFNEFINRADVLSLPLDVSGRCAPLIFGSANALVHWVCDHHPVPEVRLHAFRRQDIRPTLPGDAQPNPPDRESSLNINVYRHREEEELPSVAFEAQRYAQDNPEHTLAILVPTNEIGHNLALELDSLGAPYDNLLRGSKRLQDIAAVLQAMVALLAEPMRGRNLISVYSWLQEIEHPATISTQASRESIETLLRSVYRPESFLFPSDNEEFVSSLPAGVVDRYELSALESFRILLLELFELKPLPVDDLILTIADLLFHHHLFDEEGTAVSDLVSAYQIANVVRQWHDLQPDWRLPELAEQLNEIVHGRHPLRNVGADFGYDPEPGRISLSTQHSAKGKEWDAVFLVGIDSMWIPGDLEATFLGTLDFMNGDPIAETRAALLRLMEIKSGVYPGRSATDSAHIDIICERLRLLYVGITRARRVVNISRSRQTRRYKKNYDAPAATAMQVIYESARDYKY